MPGQRGQLVDHSVGPDPSDGDLHRSGIQCVGDDRFRANFLQRGCGIGRSRKCEYLMLVRSQATNQRPADRTARTGDQNSYRASLSARFAATRTEAHVMLSQKARLSCYDEFKNSTAPALAWPSKVQVQQFVLAYVCPVASSISAAIVSDCDLRERWLALTAMGAICLNRDVCSLVLLLDRGG